MTPTATTRLLLLLGDPVAHSLSPVFQNAAIRHHGIDAAYAALRCDAQSVAPLIRALCRAGGGGNVTVPHKAAASQCIERPTDAVLRTGACNTFWGEEGIICGDNTDVEGFRRAAAALLPDLAGARALVIGAGGAAAAGACALLDEGVARITLLNRSPDRAFLLARRLDPDGAVIEVATAIATLRDEAFDLVVNATALGLNDDDPLPFDLASVSRAGAALDLVYRQGGSTPWVSHAAAHGVAAADGREMLLAQGAAAFERWFGAAAPVDTMREALGR
jgi:shikimate dehydrogenase